MPCDLVQKVAQVAGRVSESGYNMCLHPVAHAVHIRFAAFVQVDLLLCDVLLFLHAQ